MDVAEEEGTEPPAIEEPPILFSWLEPVYRAFWQLSRQRAAGFKGAEKMRAVDIFALFDRLEPYDDAADFYEFITAMDDVFIAAVQERLSKQP